MKVKPFALSWLFFCPVFFCGAIVPLESQIRSSGSEYRVLDDLPMYRTMLLEYVNREVEASLRNLPAPESRQDWIMKRMEIRRRLLYSLGLDPLPERTPLNARMTGRTVHEDYIIENIIFESRPSLYVTANFYIPRNSGLPVPGVLLAMGHAMEYSKASAYQRTALLLVRNGYAVLAFDPIGQGERAVAGNDHWVGFPGFTVNMCINGFLVWDAVRALDYLLSRPEVDPSRIGCTGFSGGGEQTVYLAAIDDRITAAVPGRFMDSYEAFITAGVHCVDNHVPSVVQYATEADIAAMNAPRAFVSVAGIYDWIFPIWGVRDSHRRMQKIYGLLGVPGKVFLSEYEGGHGYSPPRNVSPEIQYASEYHALLGMNRYLYDDPERAVRGPIDLDIADFRDPELSCLKDGAFPEGAKTYADYIAEKAASLPPVPPLPSTGKEWQSVKKELRRKVETVLGGFPEMDSQTIHSRGIMMRDGYSIEKIIYVSEPRVFIPGLLFIPERRAGKVPAVIYVSDRGKEEAVDNPGVLRLVRRGTVVLAIDARGYGETEGRAIGENPGNIPSTANYVTTVNSVLLGRHITGMRAFDVMQGVRYLVNRHEGETDPERIGCWGKGTAALECLYAAALDSSIASLVVEEMPLSYKTLLSYADEWKRRSRYSTMHPGPFSVSVFLPDVLLHFDTPQLAALVAPGALLLVNPVDELNRPVLPERIEKTYEWTRGAFSAAGAEAGALGVETLLSPVVHERIGQWFIDRIHY